MLYKTSLIMPSIYFLSTAIISVSFFLLGVILTNEILSPNPSLPPKSDLISLNSHRGKKLLINSSLNNNYLPLSIHFISQKKLSYCGIASITMVLNALSLPVSKIVKSDDSYVFTQDSILNNQSKNLLSFLKLYFLGTTLEQLGQILESYPVSFQIYYAQSITLDDFRNLVISTITNLNSFVIVNYSRKFFKQQGVGHISPLAAYNSETDRFLILDVARNNYPPTWVKAEALYSAMKPLDFESKKSRGFIVISKN